MVGFNRLNRGAIASSSRHRLLALGALLLGFAATALPHASAQTPSKTIWDGIYSEAQARRGEHAYQRECAYCHQPDLRGGFFDNGVGRAPALTGPKAFDSSFSERWRDQTMADMVATVAATMPQQSPASLAVQAYVDIVSYLLSRNDVPAGQSELPTDVAALHEIAITAKP